MALTMDRDQSVTHGTRDRARRRAARRESQDPAQRLDGVVHETVRGEPGECGFHYRLGLDAGVEQLRHEAGRDAII